MKQLRSHIFLASELLFWRAPLCACQLWLLFYSTYMIYNYTLLCFIKDFNETRALWSCQTNEPNKRQVWETWYFWFGVGLVFILVVTSATTYLASSCKRKQQNLIRIRNPADSPGEVVITTTSGPGGIIQPDIQHFNNVVGVLRTETAELAGPLAPPYPAVEPVTIVRGSAPPQGYRQTHHYTEIVLPPGYVDSDHYKP